MSSAHAKKAGDPLVHGLMAEFHTPTELVEAAEQATKAGYVQYDCYTPFPIEELEEAMPHRRSWLPFLVLMGGLIGGLSGFGLAYVTSTITYPLNVGGKPLNSWPAFIPITFECTVLAAAFSAVLGMLILNKLPQPYHPVFNTPNFALATRDRFFLAVEANDPKFDHAKVAALLQSLNAMEVSDVEV